MVGIDKNAPVETAALRAEFAALRRDVRESGVRMEARLDAFRTDILRGITRMIVGATIVNVVIEIAAMFGVAKLCSATDASGSILDRGGEDLA